MKTLPETFRLYYYQLVIAFCNADYASAKSWQSLIESAANENPALFDALSVPHLHNLKRIRNSLRIGNLPRGLRESTDEDNLEAIPSDSSLCVSSEKALQINIAERHISTIGKMIGLPNIKLCNIEHPTENGKCDLFCREDRVAVAIEIKSGLARHDVVSQIDKYVKSLTKDFIYGLWDQVIGVVIANGFSRYAIKELPTLGVIPIRYTAREGNLGNLCLESLT